MDLSIKQIQDRLFKTILDQSLHSIVFVDGRANINIWNRAAERLFGISSQQAIGRNYFELIHPLDQTEWEMERFQTDSREQRTTPLHAETRVKLANGMEIWVDQTIHHFQIADENWAYIEVRDAEPRKHRETELQRAATTDELSQLVNRRGFQRLLEDNLNRKLSVAIVDVDRFKEINDRFGHEIGDEAIQFVADQMKAFFVDPVCVARLGGDEFGVVLPAENRKTIEMLFDELRERITVATFSKQRVRLTVSIGVAISNRPGTSARDLLSTADRAMYLSKNAGRDRVTTLALDH